MHENRIEFELTGERALFSDPATRPGGEKLTYLVPTYEALKGVVQSIYWKPTIVWIIDAVRVMNRIRTESVAVRPIKFSGGNDLSSYTYLRDVRYRVRAHFVWNENRPELSCDRDENKHHNIARRALARGGRRDIFLGVRECQGYVRPCPFDEGEGEYDKSGKLNFGNMFHGYTYPDEAGLSATGEVFSVPEKEKGFRVRRFFDAEMENGVIHFPPPEKCKKREPEKRMSTKKFLIGQTVELPSDEEVEG